MSGCVVCAQAPDPFVNPPVCDRHHYWLRAFCLLEKKLDRQPLLAEVMSFLARAADVHLRDYKRNTKMNDIWWEWVRLLRALGREPGSLTGYFGTGETHEQPEAQDQS
ncbi:MAG: hypothetical protein IPO08_23720 [Xanthomonadales bacterium]|nr:hypothetical protein [Xanthomonadales bacterium]